MIKRTPQEIADFFGCYVVQSGENGDWYAMLYKPTRHENGWAYTFVTDVMVINEQLISSSTNHDWTHLYEPHNTHELTHEERMEAPHSDNKSDACYADKADSDNKAQHQSEVFAHRGYCVIRNETAAGLSAQASRLIDKGYEPVGGVAIGYEHGVSLRQFFYQAMARGV